MIPRPGCSQSAKTRGLGVVQCAAGFKVGRGHHAGSNHHPAGRSAGMCRGYWDTPIMGNPSPSFHWAYKGEAGTRKGWVKCHSSRARVSHKVACMPTIAADHCHTSTPGHRTGTPWVACRLDALRRLAGKRGGEPIPNSSSIMSLGLE